MTKLVQSSKGELVRMRLTALFLVLLITAPIVSRVEGMSAVLMNKMNQNVGITCYKEGGDFGYRIVTPGHSYIFEIGDAKDFPGRKYACSFAATGKPQTVLDVFLGTGGLNNEPCECVGDFCPWFVTNDGFSCNFNHFTHGWGN